MKHGRKLAAATTGLILAGSAAMTGTPASAATNMKGGPLPAGTTAINILNLNDFHGRIDTDGKGTLGKNFACTILTQREQLGAANTLTLGAGDLIGGSPFTSAVQDDNPDDRLPQRDRHERLLRGQPRVRPGLRRPDAAS